MAVTVTITQFGDDKGATGSIILAAQNPLFFIFDVVSTSSEPDLSIKWVLSTNTESYTFYPVNLDFDGLTGTFLFDGTNIFNAMLNPQDDDDSIVTTGNWTTPEEMFIQFDLGGSYSLDSSSYTDFYDGSVIFANAAHEIGDINGATLNNWFPNSGEERTFYTQADKTTYWYFYAGSTGTKFLEYVKEEPDAPLPILTNNTEALINNGDYLINTIA